MTLRARRPSLLHVVDPDAGAFDIVSDAVPFPRSLDAVEGALLVVDARCGRMLLSRSK